MTSSSDYRKIIIITGSSSGIGKETCFFLAGRGYRVYALARRKASIGELEAEIADRSLGNLVTAAVNTVIQNPDGSSTLQGASYFLFFAGMMFVAAVLFVPVAMAFKERTYIQESYFPVTILIVYSLSL